MSDPVSSMDVEDVLSSIRRLVSEEAKGTDQPGNVAKDIHAAAESAVEDAIAQLSEGSARPNKAQAVGQPPSNEFVAQTSEQDEPKVSFRHKSSANERAGDQRLVLTSAFRVTTPEPAPDPAPLGESELGGADDADADSVSNLAPLSGSTDPVDIPASAEQVPETENNPTAFPLRAENPDPAETSQAEEGAPLATPIRPVRPLHPHLRSVSEEDGTAENAPEIDASEAAANSDTPDLRRADDAPASEHHVVIEPEDTLFERARQAMETAKGTSDPLPAYVFEAAQRPGDNAESPHEPTSDFLSSLRASLRVDQTDQHNPKHADAPASGISDTAEHNVQAPEGSSDPVEAEDVAHDAEKAASPFRMSGGAFDAAATDSEVTEAEPEEFEESEPSTINFAEEDSIIDEETLRDIVSEMVREELQGELGDRITRNVRKLVRREIQRALATREFE